VQLHKSQLCSSNITGAATAAGTEDSSSSSITKAAAASQHSLINSLHANIHDCREKGNTKLFCYCGLLGLNGWIPARRKE